MDDNTAVVLFFGIFMGLPVLTMGAVAITRMILEYLGSRHK